MLRASHRPSLTTAVPKKSAKAGANAVIQVDSQVQKARQTDGELLQAKGPASEPLPHMRKTARGCYPRAPTTPKVPFCRPVKPGSHVSDIFSGKGGVSKPVRELGFSSHKWELMHGAQSDLCQKAVRCQLNQDCSQNLVIGAMLAPPCGSSSVARDRTAVMRTKSFPWGLPPYLLSDTDCEKVAVGNRCFRAAIDLIRTFNRFNIPWILENPHSSKCWNIPFLQSVVEHAALETFVVDFCQYGTQ